MQPPEMDASTSNVAKRTISWTARQRQPPLGVRPKVGGRCGARLWRCLFNISASA